MSLLFFSVLLSLFFFSFVRFILNKLNILPLIIINCIPFTIFVQMFFLSLLSSLPTHPRQLAVQNIPCCSQIPFLVCARSLAWTMSFPISARWTVSPQELRPLLCNPTEFCNCLSYIFLSFSFLYRMVHIIFLNFKNTALPWHTVGTQ